MKISIIVALTSLSLNLAAASASETTVEVLNSKNGENLVFSEKFTRIAKGGTITFKAAKPGHNAEFIPGAFPQGAEELHGQIGKDNPRHSIFSAPTSFDARPITEWEW